MLDSLNIVTNVIDIINTILHEIRLLLNDFQNLKNASKIVKRLQKNLRFVETMLIAFNVVSNRKWKNLDEIIIERSKTTISTCTKACDQFKIDLER